MPKAPSPTSPITVGIDVGGPTNGFHSVALAFLAPYPPQFNPHRPCCASRSRSVCAMRS
jgi:hypothetical protein